MKKLKTKYAKRAFKLQLELIEFGYFLNEISLHPEIKECIVHLGAVFGKIELHDSLDVESGLFNRKKSILEAINGIGKFSKIS